MSILDPIYRTIAKGLYKRGYNLEDPNTPLGEALTGMYGARTGSGITVSPESSMRSTAVLACVRVIAETIASLPVDTFKRLDGSAKEKARSHYAYRLLHDQPNPYMTSFTWRETMMGHILLWGNHYSYMVLNGSGGVKELWPLPPWSTRQRIDKVKGRVFDTIINGQPVTLPAGLVLHIPGFGFDGLSGRSIISMASEPIGTNIALDRYQSAFFGKGASPSGVLSKEGNLSEPAQERLRTQFEQMNSGLGNAFRTLILEEGLKWTQVQMNPRDAQVIEARRYSVSDIARIFRVPLMLIQYDGATTTYASAEQFMLSFVMHTIRPWLVRLEQAINTQIFTVNEQKNFFVEFNMDGLLRGDFATRQNGLSVMRQNGIISADEWREKENLNPIPGGAGQVYLNPLNMAAAAPPDPDAPSDPGLSTGDPAEPDASPQDNVAVVDDEEIIS